MSSDGHTLLSVLRAPGPLAELRAMAADEIERLRGLTENNARSWDAIVRERNALRTALTELLADLDDPELIEVSAATITRARQALIHG